MARRFKDDLSEPSTTVSIRITPTLWEDLKALAGKHDLNRNSLIVAIAKEEFLLKPKKKRSRKNNPT